MTPEELNDLRSAVTMLETLVETGEVDTIDIKQTIININCIITNNSAAGKEDPMIYKFSDYHNNVWNNNGGPSPRGAA